MKRILVTGASGLLGRPTLRALSSLPGAVATGQAFSRAAPGLLRADLRSDADLDALFASARPDCVIHCAAERRPDVSEKDPEATTALNIDSTRKLAARCAAAGAWLVYVSTDYVFDGTRPPYRPEDPPHPLNHYGRTKLAGERAALEELPGALVLRVPVLFGWTVDLAESAVTVIATAFDDSKPKKLDHWAARYPTFTDDVAIVIRQIVERKRRAADFGGVYHWSGDERLTKYEMALAIAKIWGIDASHISPDPSEPAGAPRPRDCQLDCSALEALGIGHRSRFDNALRTCIEPFRPNRH